ncbi:hypothetical protein AOT41_02430 [Limosilactobacillus fermentum]|nr:hypothetical protein AOT41_02430 [Limosilactobacillus fermentum]
MRSGPEIATVTVGVIAKGLVLVVKTIAAVVITPTVVTTITVISGPRFTGEVFDRYFRPVNPLSLLVFIVTGGQSAIKTDECALVGKAGKVFC